MPSISLPINTRDSPEESRRSRSLPAVLADAEEADAEGGCYTRALNESVADVVDFYREEAFGGVGAER